MEQRKAVLVTGSSRGIGRNVAIAFAKSNYDVALHYNSSEEEALSAMKEVTDNGVKCCLLKGDTGDAEVPERLIKEAAEKLGRLDVFVANAGFFHKEKLTELTVDLTDKLYRVNFRSTLLGCKAAANYFIANGIKGCILINTSVRAFNPHSDDCVYGALKAGLNRIISSFVIEMGHYGIRVNGFAPGVINMTTHTPEEEKQNEFYANTHRFIPLRRNGYGDDIAWPVVWLASDEAKYVNGAVLKVDAGLSCIGAPEDKFGLYDAFDLEGL